MYVLKNWIPRPGYKAIVTGYCTILISSARGVTCDHMAEIKISANQIGTWDTHQKFGHGMAVGEVEGQKKYLECVTAGQPHWDMGQALNFGHDH